MQLQENEKNFIKKTLKAVFPHARFLVFGSRLHNQAKRYSDLDIAIDNGQKIQLATLSKLEEKFAESDIPFKIDLIDFYRVNKDFQQRILKDYQEL